MKDCLFCKIIAKEIPALRVYEDQDTIAFLELFPSSPGHTMVIHKKHGNNILEYTQDQLGSLMGSVQTVAEKIEKSLKTDSITIGINHKEKKGVPHLHIHLIPRWDNDKGHVIQGVVTKKTKESREAIAEMIRIA
jgi:histidine triad (HIT) family protein